MVIKDSIIYARRAGGLEELNINNHETKYHWAGYYVLESIVADTGNTYVYMSGNSRYIGRYNHNTNKYENISNGNLQNKQLGDIDVASNGKVWVTTTNTFKNVAIYDGSNWILYPNPANIYWGFGKIKVINDSSAYLLYASQIYKFHNGIYDSVYTLPSSGAYFSDWDVDAGGGLWIAATNKLIHLQNSNAFIYDASNTPIGTDQFLNVKVGANGHVWTAGNKNKLLEFDGTAWQARALPGFDNSIENFFLDKLSNPKVMSTTSNGIHHLLLYNGSNWSTIPFPFMPFKQAKEMGAASNTYSGALLFATNEGLFTVTQNFSLSGFSDTTTVPHADDVTCFTDNDPNYTPAFGSHEGVCSLPGFDNSQLPSKNVNHICFYNGTYYIGTDSGLVTYNGIFYNNINTSNSPLPSNKITYVTVNNSYCGNYNVLYVGTDNGLAVYQNAQWTVYSTGNIQVNNFYVTGAASFCGDSAVYISTLGNGLIQAYPHGSYNLFNTSNGKLLDDTLHYIKDVQLGECGQFLILGTQHHGLASTGFYNAPLSFNYDTLDWNSGQPIHSSMAIEMFSNSGIGGYIVSTNAGYYSISICGGVPESKETKHQLNWLQQNNQLIVSAPVKFNGKGTIILSNMLGQTVIESDCDTRNGATKLDINNLSSGIYMIRLNIGDETGFSKVILSR